jgi:hypothetical protein
MAFPTSEEQIRAAENALAVAFPAALRRRLLRENGGELEAADDVWQLFPVQDTTDRKRLSRTANHIVRETAEARKWPGFPPAAIAIASDGSGNYLILEPSGVILLWDHESGSVAPVEVTWES